MTVQKKEPGSAEVEKLLREAREFANRVERSRAVLLYDDDLGDAAIAMGVKLDAHFAGLCEKLR